MFGSTWRIEKVCAPTAKRVSVSDHVPLAATVVCQLLPPSVTTIVLPAAPEPPSVSGPVVVAREVAR